MPLKKISTLVLLLFVVASIGMIIVKERGGQAPAPGNAPAAVSAPAQTASAGVVAYYFHGNFRCPTCRKIEALTTEALHTRFAGALKDGRLELKVINIEDPAHEHYVRDFEVSTRTVVLARYEGGKQKEWKRLDDLWQLTEDKDAFMSRVEKETNALLKDAP